MGNQYKTVTGDDLPFLRGTKGYREIIDTLARQNKDKPPIKDLYKFCQWLGSQPDMEPAIDFVVERHTFDINLLQKLLDIANSNPSALNRGVL